MLDIMTAIAMCMSSTPMLPYSRHMPRHVGVLHLMLNSARPIMASCSKTLEMKTGKKSATYTVK